MMKNYTTRNHLRLLLFQTMACIQLALQEQGYSPKKSVLVVSTHTPTPRATAEQQQSADGGGAVPPHQEERRGCSNNSHENEELAIGIANR